MMKPPIPELSTGFCYQFSRWLVEDYLTDKDVCFGTIHGSYLYGTAHLGSDVDGYVVLNPSDRTSRNRSIHDGNLDIQVMNWETFTELCESGAHQAVEALTSPYKVFAPCTLYRPLVEHLRYNRVGAIRKALSAATAFYYSGMETNNKKLLQHAVRLRDAAQQHYTGTYSPVWKQFGEL